MIFLTHGSGRSGVETCTFMHRLCGLPGGLRSWQVDALARAALYISEEIVYIYEGKGKVAAEVFPLCHSRMC